MTLPWRLWILRHGEREATLDLPAVPGVGAEIVLGVDGEMRRTRLFRSHEQAELSARLRTHGRRSRRADSSLGRTVADQSGSRVRWPTI